MTPEQSLELNFRETLKLPDDAVQYLMDLWNMVQVLDDVADGDAIDRKDLDRAIWSSLGAFPMNEFFKRWRDWLVPAQTMAILKWMASDLAERRGMADERSYMWRAGYYDIVCLVASLVHGPSSEISQAALSLYGEGCAAYLKEFNHA